MKILSTLTFSLFILLNIAEAQPGSNCNGFTYCASFGNNANSEWIESFMFNAINNVSGSDGGYADYTNFSTDIVVGETYPITCEVGQTGSWTEFFRVWIDYNIDGDFDDPGELVFDPGGTTTTQSGLVTVPITASIGSTAMRVSMKFASESTPCEQAFSFGEVEDYCVNIVEGNGCYLPALTITDITENGVVAQWNEVNNAASYNIRYRELGTTTWTDINTTNQQIAIDLQPCIIYELQIQTVCDTASSSYSFSYEFLTLGCGGCIDNNYCSNTQATPSFGYIADVSLDSWNNASGNDGGFGDYTGPVVASLEQGLNYDVSVTYETTGFPVSNYFVVWIDFNSNGSFDDPFEKVLDSGEATLDLTVNQSFPVPPTAVVGSTRMRVMMQAFNTATPLPCADFITGEYEDYCVEILEGSGCYLPLGLEVVDFQDDAVTITWEDGLDAESFNIRYRESGTFAWTLVEGITDNMYTLTDLEGCTDYEYQFRTVCTDMITDYSETKFFKTFGCGACYDYTYCESFSTSSFFEFIQTVSLGTMNNNSGDNFGYMDFDDDFGLVLRPDSTYQLYLEPFFTFGEFNVNWKVWLDVNADGMFDEGDDLLYNSGLGTAPISTSITIPSDAVFGLTKMRVSMSEFSVQFGCDIIFNGEVEDYCVNIEPLVFPCLEPEDQDTTNVTTSAVDLIWDMDQYETAIGYIIRYKAVDETEWSETSTNVPIFEVFGLTACTEYEYQVRSVCPKDLSDYTESFVFKTACLTSTEAILAEDITSLSVFPNPFDDRIRVDLRLAESSDLYLELYNINGQLIQQNTFDNLASGAHQLTVNPSAISSGMYFLKVATKNSLLTRKLIKR